MRLLKPKHYLAHLKQNIYFSILDFQKKTENQTEIGNWRLILVVYNCVEKHNRDVRLSRTTKRYGNNQRRKF